MFSKTFILVYAGIAYLLALANLAYIVGFLADFGVPKGISDGESGSVWSSVAINLLRPHCDGFRGARSGRGPWRQIPALPEPSPGISAARSVVWKDHGSGGQT